MGTIQWTMILMAGILAGAGLGFWLGKMGRRDDVERIAEVETELKAYRDRVTEHFGQSAAHFQAIGQQYRELYEHMAAGSESLCDISETDGRLRFPRPNELVIENSADVEEGVESESAPVQEAAGGVVEEKAEESAGTPTAEEAASEQEADAASPDAQRVQGDEAAGVEAEVEAADAATADPNSDPSNRIYH